MFPWVLALVYVPRPRDRSGISSGSSGPRINASLSTLLGLCLLSVTMICWEILLSKGQEWDWFGDPFFRVQTLSGVFVLGLAGLIYRELSLRNPLIALRSLADRNFRCCCIIIFCAYGVLYANTVSLPALLQSLFGYNATTSGLVLSPAGIFAIAVLIIVGAALTRGVDARYLMAGGLRSRWPLETTGCHISILRSVRGRLSGRGWC